MLHSLKNATLILNVYSSRDQDCDFDRAKAPGFADRKSVHISNIDRLAIDKPRELSHGSKSNPDPGWSIHIQDHNAYQQFLVHESLINV